jgi:glucose/mannose-6-phosphate isomerase
VNKLIKTFPQQLQEALNLAHQIEIASFSKESIQHIAVSGMGGSGIGVHIVKSIIEDSSEIPVTLIQGYNLPKWINEKTLFVACSYSGNTEETLSLLELARKKTNHVFSITTGGELKEISDVGKIPQYNFSGEPKCPRAGLAFPSVALLMLIHKLGFCPEFDIKTTIEATVPFLEKEQFNMQEVALGLAKRIHNNFTFIYADQKFYGAALRCQQQLAENSKQLSHMNVFPELNHNELVGWQYPEHHIEKSKVLLLRSDFDHNRNQKRMDISKAILAEKTEVIELKAKGENITEQMYYFIHLIDWISFYLAEQNQIDPFPVDKIDFLKNKLAE